MARQSNRRKRFTGKKNKNTFGKSLGISPVNHARYQRGGVRL